MKSSLAIIPSPCSISAAKRTCTTFYQVVDRFSSPDVVFDNSQRTSLLCEFDVDSVSLERISPVAGVRRPSWHASDAMHVGIEVVDK